MILVVADTAPLRYLVEIGYEYLLPRLFTKIWIPGAVVEELRQARTPAIVRDWSSRFPSWIAVREVSGPSPRARTGLPGSRGVGGDPTGQTLEKPICCSLMNGLVYASLASRDLR